MLPLLRTATLSVVFVVVVVVVTHLHRHGEHGHHVPHLQGEEPQRLLLLLAGAKPAQHARHKVKSALHKLLVVDRLRGGSRPRPCRQGQPGRNG
eukprot:1180160-Prorocentrum_minimum.AAC.2